MHSYRQDSDFDMSKGTLIILNGGASAGKTTLGKALQDATDECYLPLGIDAFLVSLPPRQLDLDRALRTS
jgi:chloramphenicol 3-O-phosphotransferase